MTAQQILAENEKEIGNFKLKFKATFDKAKSDYIFLKFSVSEDFKKLIKECVIEETQEFAWDNGEEDLNLTRYKVKKWIYSALYSEYKDFLFLKELVDNGETSIAVVSVAQIDRIIEHTREGFRRLVEVFLKYNRLDLTVNYNLEKLR